MMQSTHTLTRTVHWLSVTLSFPTNQGFVLYLAHTVYSVSTSKLSVVATAFSISLAQLTLNAHRVTSSRCLFAPGVGFLVMTSHIKSVLNYCVADDKATVQYSYSLLCSLYASQHKYKLVGVLRVDLKVTYLRF